MTIRSFFLLFLIFFLPIALAQQANENGESTQSDGQDVQPSSQQTKQHSAEELVALIKKCTETKGQQCPDPKSLAQQKAITDPRVREALTEAKKKGVDLSIAGNGKDIKQRLQDVVQQEGQSPERSSTPAGAMQQTQEAIPPTREQLGQQAERPEGQQDLTQSLSGIAQLLQSVSQLLGVLRQQDPTQTAQTPPSQVEQRETYKTCDTLNGKRCNVDENSCSSTVNAPDITSENLVCCLGECKPKTKARAEAEKNVKEAKETLPSPFQVGEKKSVVTAGPTSQETGLLNKGTDTISSRTNTIDVLNGKGTNLYTLHKTRRGVTNYGGIFIFDTVGEMTVSVAENDGALTLDQDGLLLWSAPGVTKYSADHEVYETNARLFSPQLGILLQPVAVLSQPITGSVTFSPPKASFTFGRGKMTDLIRNAIDVSLAAKGEVDYIILAHGKEDLLLLGDHGFFPLAIRTFAKGDTHIVYDRSVTVKQRYKVKDVTYEYVIVPQMGMTKVVTSRGKTIEESTSLPVRELSPLQQSLLVPKNT